jgi:hypothetical protein
MSLGGRFLFAIYHLSLDYRHPYARVEVVTCLSSLFSLPLSVGAGRAVIEHLRKIYNWAAYFGRSGSELSYKTSDLFLQMRTNEGRDAEPPLKTM